MILTSFGSVVLFQIAGRFSWTRGGLVGWAEESVSFKAREEAKDAAIYVL